MAAPPELHLPWWAPWAALLAVAALGVLAGVAQMALGRAARPPQAGVLGHFAELRRCVARMVTAVCLALAVVFLVRLEPRRPWISFDAYDNVATQSFRRVASDLVPEDVSLTVLQPMDGFVAVFDVALGLSILVAMPYLLMQVGAFLKPALRPREQRLLVRALVPGAALFVLGALFAYVAVLPAALRALYSFSAALGAQPLLGVQAFASFTIMFLLVTGLAFQTPLVMYALARVGLVGPRRYLAWWRHAIVLIIIVAGLVTPDPTPVSQMLVSVPLVGLYFFGVVLSIPASRAYRRTLDAD